MDAMLNLQNFKLTARQNAILQVSVAEGPQRANALQFSTAEAAWNLLKTELLI